MLAARSGMRTATGSALRAEIPLRKTPGSEKRKQEETV